MNKAPLLAAGLLAFGLVACKKSKPRRGELTVHLEIEPPHLNPLVQEGVWLARITMHNLFEGLLRRDPSTLKFVPALATRWKLSGDGKTITFTLRQGVRWHDGKPFGAKDVIFTFDRLKDPKVGSGSSRADFATLHRWKALGADRIQLTFARPLFKMLETISHLSILPRHVYASGDLNKHPANSRPVGTGPFKFGKWRRGSHIRLVRNESYWGKKPALEAVVYRFLRSKTKALELAKKGQLDLLPRLLPDQYCGASAPARGARIKKRYRLVSFYPVQFYWIFFNLNHPLFQDVRVRRALVQLVDRKQIAAKLYCGRAKPVSGPYWPERPGYDRSIRPRPFDRAGAKKLLAEAGWRDRDGDGWVDKGGKKFRMTYLRIATSTMQRRLIPILRDMFKKAGVEMSVETVSWPVFLKRVKEHRFHLSDLNWVSYYEQDLYQMFHSSQCQGGSNYGCYASAAADRLLSQIRATIDATRRHALERQLHRIVHEDVPGIFMFNVASVSLVSRRFANVRPSPQWFQMRDVRPAR